MEKQFEAGKVKNYRHGDLALIGIPKLPEELKESKTNELFRGSNNNSHTFKNGKIYLKNVSQFVIGYFVAHKSCVLYHPDHGYTNKVLKEAKIDEGIYELRKQCEDTNDGMKPAID